MNNRFLRTLVTTILLFGLAFADDSDFPLDVSDGCLTTNKTTGTGETVYVYLPQVLQRPDFYYSLDSGGQPNVGDYSVDERSILDRWEPLTVDSRPDFHTFDFGFSIISASTDRFTPDSLHFSALPRDQDDEKVQVYYGAGVRALWGLYTLKEGRENPFESLKIFICAPSPSEFNSQLPSVIDIDRCPRDGGFCWVPGGRAVASGP